MRKGKREWSGLDVHLFCNLEDGLEANALFTNVPRTVFLGGATDGTDGLDVLLGEAILVGVDDDPVLIELESYEGLLSVFCRYGVRVILSILYKLV